MSLPAGARFGPYEILSPLGAGGMGEVYRGRDTVLQRPVAIKVLPDSLADDPQRIARLQREARTLASLNDPNIAAIYGFAEANGRHALVLELVEGPTLAERIARGPLAIDEAVAVARQIARALDAAHQLGIVHRDLKPSNVKVREDGAVKVLDFGLAKALDTAAPEGTAAATITSTAVLTGAGVIIGSAAYMAPEQARGLAADKRADIWAFGCVLYEMLTGRRAFGGAGVTDTLAAVLRGDPDWTALPADLPGATRTLLTRCLEKDRGERVQDISTARFVLAEQAGLSSPSAGRTLPAAPGSARSSRGWIAAAAIAGVAAGAAVVWLGTRAPVPARTARFDLALGGDPLTVNTFGSLIAVSPDGTSVVYSAMRNGVAQLMLRRLDRLETTPVAGTEGGIDPFFSPDGRQIGFIVSGEMRRVSLEGGRSVTIWRGDPTFEGAAWHADGTIVFSHAVSLYRVSAAGGEAAKIASPDAAHDEFGYDRPVLLPGSDVVTYTVELRGGRSRIDARRLAGGGATTLVEDGFGAHYLAPGYLVFARGDRLMGARFDAASLRATGDPVEIERGAFTTATDGISNLGIAADGTAAFVAGSNPGVFGRLTWLDRTGARKERIVEQPLEYPRNLRISPDGKRFLGTIGAPGQGNLWVYDVAGATPPIKLTFRDHNQFGVWSPDGHRIAFLNVTGDAQRNLVIASDGSVVQAEPLPMTGGGGSPMDWAGGALMISRESKLWLLRPPDRHETQWTPAPFTIYGARFSPDGHWVAYVSTQAGSADVWVRPFPAAGAPVRVSTGGGHEPVWSRDGNELFYTVGPTMMAARVVTTAPELRFEPPHQLFQGGFINDPVDLVLRFYDVGPDGRFLVAEPVETKGGSIVVAQHWDTELNARLPK